MRILVVEDDTEMAAILKRALGEKLHSVEVVHDGESARHFALTEDFDLIVLDLMIPRIDGIAVCRAVRAAGKSTPILILTARDLVEDRILGLDAGADDYLVKPFDIGELHARIRALTRRANRRTSDVLRAGSLSLDPRSDHAILGSRSIALTPKEFNLLRFFLEHAEQVVSRTEILEHVWDSNYEGLGNVVDVYVNYLRNKLEQDDEPRRIETIRGRGYMLRSR